MKLFSKINVNPIGGNNPQPTMVALVDINVNLIAATISKHKEFFFSDHLPIRSVEIEYPGINLYSCNSYFDFGSFFPKDKNFDLNFLKVDDNFNMEEFIPYHSLKAKRVMVMNLDHIYWKVSKLTAFGSKTYTSNLVSCSSDFGLNTLPLN